MLTPEQRDYCGQAAHAAYLEGFRIMLKYEPITQPQWVDLVEESKEEFRDVGSTCFGDFFAPSHVTVSMEQKSYMAWDDLMPSPNEGFISLLDQEKLPPLTHEVHLLGGGGNEIVVSEPVELHGCELFSNDAKEGE